MTENLSFNLALVWSVVFFLISLHTLCDSCVSLSIPQILSNKCLTIPIYPRNIESNPVRLFCLSESVLPLISSVLASWLQNKILQILDIHLQSVNKHLQSTLNTSTIVWFEMKITLHTTQSPPTKHHHHHHHQQHNHHPTTSNSTFIKPC